MADKQELITNVKNWITLDSEIKQLQKLMKEKRKAKKAYTESLVNIMRDNEIDCFDIQDGKLLYTKKKVKAPLSKKHLLSSLSNYFKDNKDLITELGEFILNSREEKIKENIRRK
tara:strand:- start:1130 stop:1474 length:345 start_codon:yes stop_codon:yes gene_type:complete